MRATDRVLVTSSLLVAGSTVGLPYVSGYGTVLFQLLGLGAWRIAAKLSSGIFASQHLSILWTFAVLLVMVGFFIVAVPMWLITRNRLPRRGTVLIICWTVFYIAMLFVLFPATDGLI